MFFANSKNFSAPNGNRTHNIWKLVYKAHLLCRRLIWVFALFSPHFIRALRDYFYFGQRFFAQKLFTRVKHKKKKNTTSHAEALQICGCHFQGGHRYTFGIIYNIFSDNKFTDLSYFWIRGMLFKVEWTKKNVIFTLL